MKWSMVHFIGFNALNECEKVIMTRLKTEGKPGFTGILTIHTSGAANLTPPDISSKITLLTSE